MLAATATQGRRIGHLAVYCGLHFLVLLLSTGNLVLCMVEASSDEDVMSGFISFASLISFTGVPSMVSQPNISTVVAQVLAKIEGKRSQWSKASFQSQLSPCNRHPTAHLVLSYLGSSSVEPGTYVKIYEYKVFADYEMAPDGILVWTKQLAMNETLNIRRQIDAINVAPPVSTALISSKGPGLQNLVFFQYRKCCALSRPSSVQQPVMWLGGPDIIFRIP